MGFAANQARLMMLISRQRDLELEAQFISNHRMFLGNMVTELFSLSSKLDPNTEASRVLNARIRSLQQADKVLELHLNRINSQIKAVEKESESAQKLVDKNIEKSFGLLGGR